MLEKFLISKSKTNMNTKKTMLLLSIFLITTVLNAQNDENISINGSLRLDHISFFEEKENTVNSRNQSLLQLDFTSRLNNNYSLFSSVEFRNDLSDATRNRVRIDEAYIDLFFKRWDLRVGKQIILWGKADGFNPMNVLNAVDYSDILDTADENLGIFALNGKWYLGKWELQTIYSPIFTNSILPSANSRWQVQIPPSINIQGNDYQAIYSMAVDKPIDRLRNGQVAVRLSRNFNRFDFSFAYFNGYNSRPAIIRSAGNINSDNNSVEINIMQKYYRHQVIAADFSMVLGKYIFKGEGGLYFPQNIPNNNPYFQYVVGFDRTFANVIGDNDLFVILQWIHEIRNENPENSMRDFNHLFQRNLMCRLEMDFSGNTKISLQGMYSLKDQDFYIKPEISYNIADGLNLSLAADLLGGNKKRNGLFSGYSDNSRMQAKLRYSF
jgi:hypothetical protein